MNLTALKQNNLLFLLSCTTIPESQKPINYNKAQRKKNFFNPKQLVVFSLNFSGTSNLQPSLKHGSVLVHAASNTCTGQMNRKHNSNTACSIAHEVLSQKGISYRDALNVDSLCKPPAHNFEPHGWHTKNTLSYSMFGCLEGEESRG